MAKKTMHDEIYGQITYKNGYWELKEKSKIKISNKVELIKVEIEVYDEIYEEYKLGILDSELMKFHKMNPSLLNEEEAESIKNIQKDMYIKYFLSEGYNVSEKIEDAAIRKRDEILEDQTEESFSKIVGKEKAKRVFKAKTREEKLESIVLKKMRIFKDSIEISCTCDWFSPSGGFTIFEDGNVEMFYIDSMNI